MYFYKNEFSAVLTRSCALKVLNRTTPSRSIQFVDNILKNKRKQKQRLIFCGSVSHHLVLKIFRCGQTTRLHSQTSSETTLGISGKNGLLTRAKKSTLMASG